DLHSFPTRRSSDLATPRSCLRQAEWFGFFPAENTFGFEIKLNSLGPPTGFGPLREQCAGKAGKQALLNFNKKCGFHRLIHFRVHAPDPSGVIYILDMDLFTRQPPALSSSKYDAVRPCSQTF